MKMKIVCLLVMVMVLYNGLASNGVSTNVSNSARPSVINIGSIFSFDSIVGRVAKVAIEAAIRDVNSDPNVLRGSILNITMQDSNYSGFLGIIEGMSCLVSFSQLLITLFLMLFECECVEN